MTVHLCAPTNWDNALRHTKKLQLWRHNIKRETGSSTNSFAQGLVDSAEPKVWGKKFFAQLFMAERHLKDSLKTLEDNEIYVHENLSYIQAKHHWE